MHLLLPFGPHLISVDDDSKVVVWDVEAQQPYVTIEFQNESFNGESVLLTFYNQIVRKTDIYFMQMHELWTIGPYLKQTR